MPINAGNLYLNIRADRKKLPGDLDKAKHTIGGAAGEMQKRINSISFKRVAIAATAAATAAVYALQKITREIISLANVQEAAEKRLQAVIRSTGQTAGFTAAEMIKMAAAMQKVTTVGDEVIIGGMAMLATFKQIRGEGFERTMMAALDLSDVMQQDLRSSVVMLGKAMNDPIANLGALGRAGIQFEKEQKELIKTLWKSGKTMEAQELILNELESQFGGAAKAARDTFSGALKATGNTIGDFGERLGFAITKNQDLIKELGNLRTWFDENGKEMAETFGEVAGNIIESLLAIIKAVNKVVIFGLETLADAQKRAREGHYEFIGTIENETKAIIKSIEETGKAARLEIVDLRKASEGLVSTLPGLAGARKLMFGSFDDAFHYHEAEILEDFHTTSKKVGKIIVESTKETVDEMDEAYQHFLDNVHDRTADTFYDIFTSIGDGWKSLTDRIYNFFLRMLAEMAAAAVARPIIIPMMTAMFPSMAAAGGASGGGYGSTYGGFGTVSSAGWAAAGRFGTFLNTPAWGGGYGDGSAYSPEMANAGIQGSAVGPSYGQIGAAAASVSAIALSQKNLEASLGSGAGGVVGGAIGMYFGGPAGMMLGALIGSWLGGIIGDLFSGDNPLSFGDSWVGAEISLQTGKTFVGWTFGDEDVNLAIGEKTEELFEGALDNYMAMMDALGIESAAWTSSGGINLGPGNRTDLSAIVERGAAAVFDWIETQLEDASVFLGFESTEHLQNTVAARAGQRGLMGQMDPMGKGLQFLFEDMAHKYDVGAVDLLNIDVNAWIDALTTADPKQLALDLAALGLTMGEVITDTMALKNVFDALSAAVTGNLESMRHQANMQNLVRGGGLASDYYMSQGMALAINMNPQGITGGGDYTVTDLQQLSGIAGQWYSAAAAEAFAIADNMNLAAEASERILTNIKFGALNPALPTLKAKEATDYIFDLYTKAKGGDTVAMQEFAGFAPTYLQLAKESQKSSAAYQTIYQLVTGGLQEFADLKGSAKADLTTVNNTLEAILTVLKGMEPIALANTVLQGSTGVGLDTVELDKIVEIQSQYGFTITKDIAEDILSDWDAATNWQKTKGALTLGVDPSQLVADIEDIKEIYGFAGGGIAVGPKTGYPIIAHGTEKITPMSGGGFGKEAEILAETKKQNRLLAQLVAANGGGKILWVTNGKQVEMAFRHISDQNSMERDNNPSVHGRPMII